MKKEARELNVMRTRRKAFKKGESVTIMNFAVSSKALFQLSGEALKLYMFFLLNGKKSEPSKKKFARMMKKSERTIDNYYKELKEKGFLDIVQIGYNRYRYDFDINGNVNHDFNQEIKEIKQVGTEEEVSVKKEVQVEVVETETTEQIEEFNLDIVELSKEIMEFEDFAVLENVYWQLEKQYQDQVIKILVHRYNNEEYIKEAIEWVFEKINKEELLNGKQ